MNRLIILLIMAIGLNIQLPFVHGCRLLVPAELINGCIFDPMILSNPTTQFSINRETCNAMVNKDNFNEQPIVYFGRAKQVNKQYIY